MRSFFYLALLAATLISIAFVVRSGMLARKDPGRPINSTMRAALEAPQLGTDEAMIVAKRYGNAHRTQSGLRYLVTARGEGPVALKTQLVSVHYTGTFLDGTIFDSSSEKGGPLNFPLGRGIVIPAWEEALLSMKKGEKRTLIVPYWLGYGEKGFKKIPPRATLIFDIELVDIR